MPRKALIVVDMQNDFLTGTLALSECPAKQDGVKTVSVINKLIEESDWDLVVYTFDWHPNDHISFVTNAHKYPQHADSQVATDRAEVYNKVTFDIDGDAREQVMWPPHCIQGSWGAEIHKDLQVTKTGCRVYKGQNEKVDSYSAFYDNDKLQETSLRKMLLDENISATYICGVATDVCVNFTAVDSQEIGFKTHVIVDACAGVTFDGIRESIEKWKNIGIKVVTSDQVVEKYRKDEIKKPSSAATAAAASPPLRRSTRQRRPPSRYRDNWGKAA